jgi:cysteine desulfurase
MTPIYLDYLSANPLLPEVQEAMIAAIRKNLGNPSSQHQLGDQAAEALEKARGQVACLLNCANPKEIVFTSGARKASIRPLGVALANQGKGNHLVTSISSTMPSCAPFAGCGC